MFYIKTRQPESFGPLTEALTLANLRWFRENGLIPFSSAAVRYRRDPPGVNLYQRVDEVVANGGADCKSLTAWVNAEAHLRGIPAVPLVTRSGQHLYHVRSLLWPNTPRARIVDGSMLKGMPPPRR